MLQELKAPLQNKLEKEGRELFHNRSRFLPHDSLAPICHEVRPHKGDQRAHTRSSDVIDLMDIFDRYAHYHGEKNVFITTAYDINGKFIPGYIAIYVKKSSKGPSKFSGIYW